MSSSLFGTGWTLVLKVVTGTLVSTNIQEFWTSDNGLNLQDVRTRAAMLSDGQVLNQKR